MHRVENTNVIWGIHVAFPHKKKYKLLCGGYMLCNAWSTSELQGEYGLGYAGSTSYATRGVQVRCGEEHVSSHGKYTLHIGGTA